MQQRDAAEAERRRERALARAQEAQRREARLQELAEQARPQSAVHVGSAREPGRLVRPTAAAQRREREVADARESRAQAMKAAGGVPSRFASSSLGLRTAGIGRGAVAWRSGP